MNGVHDMGGMQGMGPIAREADEPTFHHPWEGRVYAMTRVLRARGGNWKWNLDAFRHGIEILPPAEYLRMTYYERWFAWMTGTLVATGDVAQSEIDAGQRAPGAPIAAPAVTAQIVPTMVDLRPTARRTARAIAHFKSGQRVRARNLHPPGHTRLPRYARGKVGVVVRDRGVFLFPDTHAHDLGEQPQHLYSVRFAARELWGERASPRDFVHLDMWDDYLERL
ncbi:MAG TPA: nitrile hydratase subunit beta [Vicinamibacterales bacterium]|nr:nitrile hydratase subunit beta [Vicinamibacterales bacterium]